MKLFYSIRPLIIFALAIFSPHAVRAAIYACGLFGGVPGDGAEFSLRGVLSGDDKTGPAPTAKTSYKFVYQVTGANLAGIVGSLDDRKDPDGDDLLIEDSVSFGAEKAVDIITYPTD